MTNRRVEEQKQGKYKSEGKREKAKPRRDVWVGFFDVPFPPEMDADYDTWAADNETELWEMVDAAARAGWKTAVVYNDKAGGFVASMTGDLRPSAAGAETVTAWSDSALDATLLLYFKLYVLCDMDWENAPKGDAPERPRRR